MTLFLFINKFSDKIYLCFLKPLTLQKIPISWKVIFQKIGIFNCPNLYNNPSVKN